MKRFPAEAGVLVCLGVACISLVGLRGVEWSKACRFAPDALFFLDGVLLSSRRSNIPKTCPSFCGVGPIAVFFEGVNILRTAEGDSYGSTSHGSIVFFEGVFIIWKRLEG
jgi:hypothetical protein